MDDGVRGSRHLRRILAFVFPHITLVSLMGVLAGFGIVGGGMLVGAAG